MKKALMIIRVPYSVQDPIFEELKLENNNWEMIRNQSEFAWDKDYPSIIKKSESIRISYADLENLIKYEKNIFIPHCYGLKKVSSYYIKKLKENGYRIEAIINSSLSGNVSEEGFDNINYIKVF